MQDSISLMIWSDSQDEPSVCGKFSTAFAMGVKHDGGDIDAAFIMNDLASREDALAIVEGAASAAYITLTTSICGFAAMDEDAAMMAIAKAAAGKAYVEDWR